MTDRLKEMLEARQAPGLSGMSDGPGSGSKEFVWARPDPKKDIPLTLQKMEEAGQLKDPASIRAARIKLKASQEKVYEKVDYDKDGHPAELPMGGESD